MYVLMRSHVTAAPPSSAGWVYIATNSAMPGLVKIGMTTRTPAARAAELSEATGVPFPFVVVWSRAVSDCGFVESVVHRMLADRRVSGRREFFRCDVRTARQVIEAGARGRLGRHYRAPGGPQRGRGWRRAGSLEALILSGAAAALLLLLAVFDPPLPGWLPAPVARGFVMVERLGG